MCRTNGDWTPPRVVILGPLIITLEVHDPYLEFGADAWDPVDDHWYPEWNDETICEYGEDGPHDVPAGMHEATPGENVNDNGIRGYTSTYTYNKQPKNTPDSRWGCGGVRMTGYVDIHNVGVYYRYYDTTDLHGNKANAAALPFPCGSKTLPLPCGSKTLPLPCVSTAFAAKTVPFPCGATAVLR